MRDLSPVSGQEVAPVPSEQAAGVPGGSGSRVCLRHVLRQLVDDRERRPPALLGAVQLAQGPVGRGSSFSVSAVALCTLSCPPRGGPAEGQRGLEAAGMPSLWRAGPTANSGQGGQAPGGPGARWTSDKSATWDSGRVSPGLWAPRAHVTGTDPACSGASCSRTESETQVPAQALPVRRLHPRKGGLCPPLSMVKPGPCHHLPLALGLRASERGRDCHGPADGSVRARRWTVRPPCLRWAFLVASAMSVSLYLSPGAFCGTSDLSPGRDRLWGSGERGCPPWRWPRQPWGVSAFSSLGDVLGGGF